MTESFHILHLEDNANDAELVRYALEVGGVPCVIMLVTGKAEFFEALERHPFDIVLADYSLPDINGMVAFEECQRRELDIPFVLITGALGEERAIECIKAGMDDYVLKTNLTRLATVVPRAIAEKNADWQHDLAMENLRLSEERFDLAVRGSGAGIWDWPDVDSEEMFWSPKIFEVLGYGERELEPTITHWEDLILKQDRAEAARLMSSHLDEHKPLDAEYRMRHKDGHTVWIRIRGSALWDEVGNPIRMAGYIQDVSDRKAAEKEVAELQKQLAQTQKMEAIGTLAGGIAHDFNNILAAIIGYASLVKTRIPRESREFEDIQKVLQAGDRAKSLVRQILTFARKTELDKQPVAIDLVVKEILQLLRASLPSTIEMKTEIDAGGKMVLGSPTEIHQVMMNLCTNAFHAMEEQGGVLSVGLRQTSVSEHARLKNGSYLLLSVRDTGEGIPAEIVERIFDPYFTTKEINKGTGLGLSMVMGIAERLGGQVEVESRPGEGSCFTVWFPCHKDQRQEEKTSMEVLPGGGSEHIMYVDDEEGLAILGQEFLEDMGYSVTPVFSSREALETFQANPDKFDLIVTDHTMPGLTGVEMAMEIEKIAPGKPVVLCSGFKMTLESPGVSETSIRGVLLKPEVFDKLPGVLREIFDRGN